MLSLEPKYLVMVKEILAKHVPDMVVWAYGSRVDGRSHGGSDLDLVVINPKDSTVPLAALSDLRAAFSESNLPISVDVMDWARIPESFKEEIKRNYVIIKNN